MQGFGAMAATKRLQKELDELNKNPNEQFSAGPVDSFEPAVFGGGGSLVPPNLDRLYLQNCEDLKHWVGSGSFVKTY